MEVISLQSGSSGNCVYVESKRTRLLFDAGISGRQAELRLKQFGKDIRAVDAVVISHEHSDHIRSISAFHRKYKLPLIISQPTLRAVQRRNSLAEFGDVTHFHSGDSFRFGDVSIETLPTPHDAVDGVAFVIDDGRRRFGLLTDLGHVFRRLQDVIPTLDAVMLESNYDSQMLIHSRYPESVKSRIAGKRGHISNLDAAELLLTASEDLQWVLLAHLSGECNDPMTAIKTHQKRLGKKLVIHCAHRDQASERLMIKPASKRKQPPVRLRQQELTFE